MKWILTCKIETWAKMTWWVGLRLRNRSGVAGLKGCCLLQKQQWFALWFSTLATHRGAWGASKTCPNYPSRALCGGGVALVIRWPARTENHWCSEKNSCQQIRHWASHVSLSLLLSEPQFYLVLFLSVRLIKTTLCICDDKMRSKEWKG